MRGRKPTPTALKLMRGNPSKTPINEAEPQFSRDVPACPPHLDAEASAEWKRIVVELAASGLLTLADRAALAAYCQAWSDWIAADQRYQKVQKVIDEEGEVVTVDEREMPNPHLIALASYRSERNRALRHMHAFISEFGLTPSSRTRVKVPPPSVEKSEFEAFLSNGTQD